MKSGGNRARRRLNLDIQPTPAIALGAYEVMRLKSRALTPCSQSRDLKKPGYIDSIRDQQATRSIRSAAG